MINEKKELNRDVKCKLINMRNSLGLGLDSIIVINRSIKYSKYIRRNKISKNRKNQNTDFDFIYNYKIYIHLKLLLKLILPHLVRCTTKSY